MDDLKCKIRVKHTCIEINNYDLGDCPKIEYIFSVWDAVTHKRYTKGIEYDEKKKKLILPRGIDISWVENQFMETAYIDKNNDPFVKTKPIPIKYLTRDERQLNTLKFLLGEGEYFHTKSKSQLSCNNATGTGKTFVTVASLCYTGSRAIIIANSIDWLNQWKDKILEYTPLKSSDLYMISGAPTINKLLNRDPLKYQIFLASHDTIKSYGDRNGWDKVEELFKYLKCGVKVYDEAHLYFDNICKIDFHSNTKKTIYLTATPLRSDKEENTIYQLYFKNVPSIDLFDENIDPHVNYLAVHFNSHPTPKDINRCKNAYGFNRTAYTDYVVHKENFLYLVTILIDTVLGMKGKTLIYIGTNNAISVVRDYIISEFPFFEPYIGIYTSVVDKSVKEQQLRKKIILSTTKSCGAASDIADLGMTINLAEPFKTPVLAIQTLGRCRADNTLYIDVIDQGFFYTKRYYTEKKPVYSRYAKSCKDLVFSDDELYNKFEKVKEKYYGKKMMCMPIFKK